MRIGIYVPLSLPPSIVRSEPPVDPPPWALRTLGADRVRVVHVLPKANIAYQQSLHRESQRALGSTVSEVWAKLLRSSDRFVAVDNSLFLDPAITSDEYVARYGPKVAE